MISGSSTTVRHNLGSSRHSGPVHDPVVGTPAEVANVLLHDVVIPVKRGHGPHAANAQDRQLLLHNHGAQVRAADVANVGHGDGASGHVGRRQLALVSELLEPHELGGNGDDVARADVLDDGDQEARGVSMATPMLCWSA